MKEENYFSWNNIGDMADIDSHIAYASSILQKYEWNNKLHSNLQAQLNAIIAKQNDKLLNISVIGEFSTGKSSFINALVGYELLAVNVLQGTTVAITMIEYSDDFSIILTYFDGRSSTNVYKSISALRQNLFIYTTDPSYANKINHIKVTLPSSILKSGFRIIDTPGTNSLELWHEDITQRAINNFSDLSIVLIDAHHPMPETLIAFVDKTLDHTIKDCAFVVNKIDLIRERERSGIIKYTKNRVCQAFDIQDPFVLPFASVALTNQFSEVKVSIDDNSFLITTESLQNLLNYTAQQRIKAQARKVLSLIDRMYTTLNTDIGKIAEEYNKEIRLLERSKQIDLKPFLKSQIAIRQKNYTSNSRDKRASLYTRSDALVDKAIKKINAKIDKCETLDNLSDYIKGNLSNDIKDEGNSISNRMESEYSEIQKFFNKELKLFQIEFEKEFEKMKILSVKFNVSTKDIAIRRTVNSANISQVTTLITEELSKENWAMGGGAVAGAIAGSIIPGIGTLAGAVIGFIAGAVAAPNADNVKSDVKSKLSTPLRSYYRTIASDSMSNYDKYVNDVNNNLEREINKYYSNYNSIVQQKIREWKTQHENVNKKVKHVKAEIDSIKHRQYAIKNIISRI